MTSIRRAAAPVAVSRTFFVQMNMKLDGSNSTEIVVAEGRVLLRISLPRSRPTPGRRETAGSGFHPASAHARLAQTWMILRAARSRCGSAMAADLRLVVHAAQAHAQLAGGQPWRYSARRGLADFQRRRSTDRILPDGLSCAPPNAECMTFSVAILVEITPRLAMSVMPGVRRPAARSASQIGRTISTRRPFRHAPGASVPLRACFRPPQARRDCLVGLAISLAAWSPSPSSFWIVRICSRSRCSRLRSSIDALVRSSISRDTFRTSMRWVRRSSSLSSRALRSNVYSSACFSSTPTSINPEKVGEPRRTLAPCSAATISSGT